jgi:hypothetical protein
MDRSWDALRLIKTDATLASIAKQLGTSPSQIYKDLIRLEWQIASMRLDFLDDPEMIQGSNDDLAAIQKRFPGMICPHEMIRHLDHDERKRYRETGEYPYWVYHAFSRYSSDYNDDFVNEMGRQTAACLWDCPRRRP